MLATFLAMEGEKSLVWAAYLILLAAVFDFSDGFAARLQDEVNAMSKLRLTDDEYKFMAQKCYYLPPAYLDFLAAVLRLHHRRGGAQQSDGRADCRRCWRSRRRQYHSAQQPR